MSSHFRFIFSFKFKSIRPQLRTKTTSTNTLCPLCATHYKARSSQSRMQNKSSHKLNINQKPKTQEQSSLLVIRMGQGFRRARQMKRLYAWYISQRKREYMFRCVNDMSSLIKLKTTKIKLTQSEALQSEVEILEFNF